MNQNGNVILLMATIIGLIILTSISLPVIMKLIPGVDLIVKIILIFIIFTTVRGYMGNGVLSLVITAILVYFLVLKWWWIASSVWFFTLLLSFGLISVYVWGTSKLIPSGQ